MSIFHLVSARCNAPGKSSHEFKFLRPEFQWSFVAQRLMRAVVIVPIKPAPDGPIGF